MRIFLFLSLFLFGLTCAEAQETFRVTGKVTNARMEPLAFVSIQVRQRQAGNITKEDGSYSLTLPEGTYDIMISMVGYKQQTIKLTVSQNYTQNIIMEEDDTRNMEDVVIRVKIKDRSEEIIRNTIRVKDALSTAALPYSCRMYIKAIQQDSTTGKKDRGKKDTALFEDPASSFEGMAMAEVSLRLDYESERRLREERLGVKKEGEAESLFYLSATAGDFNFYNNLIRVPSLSVTPFLSPVSYSGLMAYKYKMLKIDRRDGKRYYIISVKPGLLSNATVEGELTIQDSSWAIVHARFRFPSYHLPEYDFFEVEQHHMQLENKVWVLGRQQFNYYSKAGKRKLSGQTLVRYTDYETNKAFAKKHFGLEVSATAQEAYEKDSTFWSTVRTEPLTEKELRFIQYRDSIYRVTHTEQYLDSLDRITNRWSWKKVLLTGQLFYDRKKERTWLVPSVVSLYEPFQFGGGRITPTFYYYRKFASRKDVMLHARVSYGFRNKDINGLVLFDRTYNPFNRGHYTFRLYRSFDNIYESESPLNQFRRSSYFLNNYFAVGHGLEVANGLNFTTESHLALRRSVNGYKTAASLEELIKGNLDSNRQVAFNPYNGFFVKGILRYTPRQRYIREPREKIILGSKWPTFYASYFKGIPGPINSEVDFDYLEFGMEQRLDLGLLGNTRYTVKTGDFLTRKSLKLLEYNFMRKGDPVLFMNPDEGFQGLDTTFAVFNRFYSGHLVHEFNGAFLNKIPLFKKLQLREMAGAGFLIAPERGLRYGELFVGIERVFKWPLNPMQKFKVGVYAVTSWANQFKNPVQFKIGLTTWDIIRKRWN
jgi:hypothetical protein